MIPCYLKVAGHVRERQLPWRRVNSKPWRRVSHIFMATSFLAQCSIPQQIGLDRVSDRATTASQGPLTGGSVVCSRAKYPRWLATMIPAQLRTLVYMASRCCLLTIREVYRDIL